MFKILYSIYKRHSVSQRTKRSWVLSCYQVKFAFMLCWWNSHYTFNDAHIWILDATYIAKQAIDVRYIHCTNVASCSLRPRLNYWNSWSRNSHRKAIILNLSCLSLFFCSWSKQLSIDFWSDEHTLICTLSKSKFIPIEFGSVLHILPPWLWQKITSDDFGRPMYTVLCPWPKR
jgi:hypothetical protein